MVWSKGNVVFGPSQTETSWENGRLIQPLITERAINKALQLLGVQKVDAFDEFDAIGLGKHRSTYDWV